MASPILHGADPLFCPHGGIAVPVAGAERVRLSGIPVLTIDSMMTIAGCEPGPCTHARWIDGSDRVFANGRPLIAGGAAGICTRADGVVTGPLTMVTTQGRVSAA